tara:strand:- start:349 stop:810 length:462 start_codon:yes stop_codon:yes gene_type:complete
MSSLYQTTDGATVRLENNIVVGPESKFHGKEVKTNQDIMEVFGINVMKQPKTSGGTQDTMILPDGTVVPTKMKDAIFKQPATSGGTRDIQIRPDGSLYNFPQMKPSMPMNRPNMRQITGSMPTAMPGGSAYGQQKTKPINLRQMLLANFTGLI